MIFAPPAYTTALKNTMQNSLDSIRQFSTDPRPGCVQQSFDKGVVQDNFEILRRLSEFNGLDCPILIGPSRKSFIGKVLDALPDQRLEGTIAAVAIGIQNGAHIVRVHDVKEVSRACRIIDLIIGKTGI